MKVKPSRPKYELYKLLYECILLNKKMSKNSTYISTNQLKSELDEQLEIEEEYRRYSDLGSKHQMLAEKTLELQKSIQKLELNLEENEVENSTLLQELTEQVDIYEKLQTIRLYQGIQKIKREVASEKFVESITAQYTHNLLDQFKSKSMMLAGLESEYSDVKTEITNVLDSCDMLKVQNDEISDVMKKLQLICQ